MGFSALLLFINKYPLTMAGGGHTDRKGGRKSFRGKRVATDSGGWGHRIVFSPDSPLESQVCCR